MKSIQKYYIKYPQLFAGGLTFVLTMLFTLTPYWQLTILAAVIGGLLCTKTKCGILSALVGTTLAWGLYICIGVIRNNTNILFDQLGSFIIGSSGFGILLIFIILIVGALFGVLGGIIGSGIRILLDSRSSSKNSGKDKSILDI